MRAKRRLPLLPQSFLLPLLLGQQALASLLHGVLEIALCFLQIERAVWADLVVHCRGTLAVRAYRHADSPTREDITPSDGVDYDARGRSTANSAYGGNSLRYRGHSQAGSEKLCQAWSLKQTLRRDIYGELTWTDLVERCC